MIPNFKIREKILIMIASLLFIIFLSDRFIVSYIAPHIEKLQNEIVSQTHQLYRYQHVLDAEDTIQKQYDLLIRKIQIEGSADEEISKFLQYVESLCKEAQVRIIDIKPSSTKSLKYFQKIRIDIQFESSQHNIGKLLIALTNAEYMINVDQIRIVARLDTNNLQCHMYISRLIEK